MATLTYNENTKRYDITGALDPVAATQVRYGPPASATDTNPGGYTPGAPAAATPKPGEVGYKDPNGQGYTDPATGKWIYGTKPAAPTGTISPADEEAIKEKTRQEMQARIDAQNAFYDSMVTQQNTINQGQEGSTRALNARSGLLGSDFGGAQMDKTKAVGANAVNAINAERRVKITEVLGQIDTLAADRIKAAKDKAIGDQKSYLEGVQKMYDTARSSIKTLGESGISFNDLKLKDPERLKQLLDSTGYDEFQLAAAMDAADKSANKYEYKVDNNTLIGYRTNPQTGQPEVITKVIPGLENGTHKVQVTPDGTVLIIPDNIDPTKPLDEQIKKYGSEGQFAKPIAPKKPVTPKLLDQATNEMTAGLNSVVGADGFVSPQDYLKGRTAWEAQGFNVTAYDSKFAKYKNPNNPNYVTTKQPVKKTPSGRSI